MMSDIVERLRANAPRDHGLASGDLMREAAYEIEDLRAELAEFKMALHKLSRGRALEKRHARARRSFSGGGKQ